MSPAPADTPGPAERFAGTEADYAAARPGYGDETLDYLRERFALDDTTRVLDIGCGTGQLALPLAEHAGEVVGVDPNTDMLRHAERLARAEGRENVRWLVGSDADLPSLAESGALAPLRLTTMGRSFHWMDGPRTLDALSEMTEPGGGVALVTDDEWLTKGTDGWQDVVYDVVAGHVDDLPERVDPAEVEYDDPWDELLAAHGFDDVETETIPVERAWTADNVVGYVFSLSFVSSGLDGRDGDGDALEADICDAVADIGGGPLVQRTAVEILSGKK